MEKYAAEMKVVNVSLNIRYYTGVCDAISTGLGRNKLLEQVAIRGVQKEKIEFVKSKLSSMKTVRFVDL